MREKNKKTLEHEINEFLTYWDCNQMNDFLRDITPLFELYDVDEVDDWVVNSVGEYDARNVRLIRTVYLISRIAELHAGKLVSVRANFKDIYRRMERGEYRKCPVNAINAENIV